jgi:hypothetical protein
VLEYGSTLDLPQKPAAESAADRTPGVIRSETEEKSGTHAEAFEQRREAHRTFARAAIRIHIDLQRDECHGAGGLSS